MIRSDGKSTRKCRTGGLITRNGTLHQRIFVPSALQARLGRREIVLSLRTASRREAERRIVETKATYFHVFQMASQYPELSGRVLLEMARRYLAQSIESSQEHYSSTSLAWSQTCPPDFSPGQMMAADFDELEGELVSAIAENRLGRSREAVDALLAAEGHPLPAGSPKHNVLSLMVLHAMKEQAAHAGNLYRYGLSAGMAWKPTDKLFADSSISDAQTADGRYSGAARRCGCRQLLA